MKYVVRKSLLTGLLLISASLVFGSVVKEINKINELELQGNGQGSWHDDYKGPSSFLFC